MKKEICVVKKQPQEQPQKSHEQDILQKKLQIDRSFRPTGRVPWTFVRLWGFLCVRDAGRRGNKITAFSLYLFHSNFNMKLNEPYILYFRLFWSSISFVWTDGRLFTQRCRWNWPGLPATNLPSSFQHFSSIWPCGKSVQRSRLLQTHTARLNFVFGKKRRSSHATN